MDSSSFISIAIGIRDVAAVCPRRRLGGCSDNSQYIHLPAICPPRAVCHVRPESSAAASPRPSPSWRYAAACFPSPTPPSVVGTQAHVTFVSHRPADASLQHQPCSGAHGGERGCHPPPRHVRLCQDTFPTTPAFGCSPRRRRLPRAGRNRQRCHFYISGCAAALCEHLRIMNAFMLRTTPCPKSIFWLLSSTSKCELAASGRRRRAATSLAHPLQHPGALRSPPHEGPSIRHLEPASGLWVFPPPPPSLPRHAAGRRPRRRRHRHWATYAGITACVMHRRRVLHAYHKQSVRRRCVSASALDSVSPYASPYASVLYKL